MSRKLDVDLHLLWESSGGEHSLLGIYDSKKLVEDVIEEIGEQKYTSYLIDEVKINERL